MTGKKCVIHQDFKMHGLLNAIFWGTVLKLRLFSKEKYVDALFSKIEALQVPRKRIAKNMHFSTFSSAFIGYIGALLGVCINNCCLE